MKLKLKILIVACLIFSMTNISFGQQQTEAQRIQAIENQLEDFSKKHKALKESVEISVNTNLQELVRTLAENHNINITIDNDANQPFSNSLPNVTVKELLVFICKTYNLTLDFTGSIITILKMEEAPPEKTIEEPPFVEFNKFNNRLTLRLENDNLNEVLNEIITKSGINVISTPNIYSNPINANIEKVLFDEAMELLAVANGLKVKKNKKGHFTLFLPEVVNTNNQRNNSRSNNSTNRGNSNNNPGPVRLEIVASSNSSDTISSLDIMNAPINDIIKKMSSELGKDYFLFSEPTTPITLQLTNVSYDDLLEYLLRGTEHSFTIEDNRYLISKKDQQGFTTTKRYQLQHRSLRNVIEAIPEELKQGVKIDSFPELNSLLLSGSSNQIQLIEGFIEQIDISVPNVTIELIIIDVQKSNLTELGLEAGVGDEPSGGTGSVFPDVNFSFSAGAVNNLLDLLSGQSIINLGPVNPNFYVSLNAVEENGYVKVNSKPQLATLNAHPAQFKIGETRYYRNDQAIFRDGLSPTQTNIVQFEKLEANFSINITPIVSGDEQVTLDIKVEQTDFIGEIQPDAPSPQVTRQFNSNIRLKNGEMIVLGGLERKQTSNSGRGVPLLSRIPVIKWFFSKRTKNKQNSQLLIFVKPVVQF